MRRVYVLVEGQTEDTFVRDTLAPHLQPSEIFLTPILVETRRRKDGRKFRGGISSYRPVRKNLLGLLRDQEARVTTMLDYYGLSADFPGMDTLPSGKAADRAEHLEQALAAEIGDRRLLPYLSLHEFEALLFAQPETISTVIAGSDAAVARLRTEVAPFANPEDIDDGPETHPSARLGDHLPGYRKRLHGPQVVAKIGLPALREKCPHFDRWIATLENFD